MATHSSTLAWKIPCFTFWLTSLCKIGSSFIHLIRTNSKRSLVSCSPGGPEQLDTAERFHFHFLLSCIGEGNGNPLQYSCLENPRDGEPGGLPSVGSHRVGHDWSDLAAAAVDFYYLVNKELLSDCFVPDYALNVGLSRWPKQPPQGASSQINF